MSAEFRHIFFNDAEILRIVTAYHKEYRRDLPHGSVLDLSVSGDPVPMVEGRIAPDRGGEEVPFSLQDEDLRSAVISHCIRNKIPLPQRGAVKSIRFIGQRLALVVTLNVNGEQFRGL